jgi:hypothetical protein
MSRLLPCRMCGNNLSPQATFCPQCGHPQVGTEPEASKPSGVADMSGAGLRELMAIIEQNLEILRRTAIHGSGEMKELAVALLQAKGQKLDTEPPPDESQPFDTPMIPKFPGEGDLPAED